MGKNIDYLMRRGLGHARATLGLAKGLHEVFAIRLADAEEDLVRLGNKSSDDGGRAYDWQRVHTEDLRTWVAVLAALEHQADRAERDADSASERVGRAVRRGGGQ